MLMSYKHNVPLLKATSCCWMGTNTSCQGRGISLAAGYLSEGPPSAASTNSAAVSPLTASICLCTRTVPMCPSLSLCLTPGCQLASSVTAARIEPITTISCLDLLRPPVLHCPSPQPPAHGRFGQHHWVPGTDLSSQCAALIYFSAFANVAGFVCNQSA